jgi:hypothetical protein
VLYTSGNSPEEVVKQLTIEASNQQIEADVPTERTTINRWAKLYEWTPHWKDAQKRERVAIQAGEPFALSGITDPIVHLARVKGLKFCRNYVHQHPRLTSRHILQQCILYLNEELEPGPRVFRYLTPILRTEIQLIKEDHGVVGDMLWTSGGAPEIFEIPEDMVNQEDKS